MARLTASFKAVRSARTGRPLLIRLHQALAILAGAWLLIIGLTGTVLVYEDTLDRQMRPDLFKPPHAAQSFDADRIAAACRGAAPRGKLSFLELPESTRAAARCVFSAKPRLEVFVQSDGGQVLGVRPFLTPLRIVHLVHETLLLGPLGRSLATLAALCLISLIFSGAANLRQRHLERRTVRFQLSRRGAPRWRALHPLLGLWLLPSLLLSALTGLTLQNPPVAVWLAQRVDKAAHGAVLPRLNIEAARTVAPISKLIEAGQRTFPGARPATLQFPDKSGPIVLRLESGGAPRERRQLLVALDPSSGRVIACADTAREDAGTQFLAGWWLGLHNGVLLGPTYRILLAVQGVGLVFLLFSGFGSWIGGRRLNARRSSKQRTSVPSPRSSESLAS